MLGGVFCVRHLALLCLLLRAARNYRDFEVFAKLEIAFDLRRECGEDRQQQGCGNHATCDLVIETIFGCPDDCTREQQNRQDAQEDFRVRFPPISHVKSLYIAEAEAATIDRRPVSEQLSDRASL